MNRLILLLSILILTFGCSSDDSSGIFNGDIILRTQEDINDFGSYQYARINGNFQILANFSSDNIIDLSPLNSISVVDETLYIASISNLNHLELNISEVGGLTIENMQSTESISFPSLRKITANANGMNIIRCDNLTTIDLPNLTSITKSLSFIGNQKLTHLNGFSNVTTIIHPEDELLDYASISIAENPVLASLDGLKNINSKIGILNISINNSLTSLNGLHNLSLRNIKISFNESLDDFCGIGSFLSNGLTLDGNIYEDGSSLQIFENLYNPKLQDFINGDCNN